MIFTKRLRDAVRRGDVTCSVRIWMRPHVKVGNRYRMEEGEILETRDSRRVAPRRARKVILVTGPPVTPVVFGSDTSGAMPRRICRASAVLFLASLPPAASSVLLACSPAIQWLLAVEPVELPEGVTVFAQKETVVVVNGSRKPVRLTAKDGSMIGLAPGASRPLAPAWWAAGAEQRSFLLRHGTTDREIVVGLRAESNGAGCAAFYRGLEMGAQSDAQRAGAVIALAVTLAGSLMVGGFVLIRRRVGRRAGADASRVP